jgi:Ca2+/Na+ antiporter
MENQTVNPIPTTPNPTPVTPNMGQIMMPGAIMYMVFGIVSVVLDFYGWAPFFGWIFAIIALVFGILAFLKGKKMQAEYDADPNKYKKASKAFIKVAYITGLVGFIWAAIDLLISAIISIIYVAAESASYL